MDAGGWPDVRWMRVVEHGGDRNEDARRRKDVEEKGDGMEEEEDEKKEERRERKGVRVRVRLGVGGAIRNYCGTIDKRRLRGRTTEDSLRPSDFPSTVASLFPPLLSFPWFPWTSVSRVVPLSPYRALPTKPSRLVNM